MTDSRTRLPTSSILVLLLKHLFFSFFTLLKIQNTYSLHNCIMFISYVYDLSYFNDTCTCMNHSTRQPYGTCTCSCKSMFILFPIHVKAAIHIEMLHRSSSFLFEFILFTTFLFHFIPALLCPQLLASTKKYARNQ